MKKMVISGSIMIIVLTVLCFTFLFMICVDGEGEYDGEFVDGDNKYAKPGDSIVMQIVVRNTGDQETDYLLDDPILPEGWNYEWTGDNPKSIDQDSMNQFSVRIEISDDNDKALAGDYDIGITGEYNTDSGSEPISGSCYLNITVEPVYGVTVTADEDSQEGKPGEKITYRAEIRNTGNTNDTYQLSLLKAPDIDDASHWASLDDVDQGDKITLTVGVVRFVDILVEIPHFTAENEDVKHQTFRMIFRGESTNDSETESEKSFDILVEEFFNLSLWSEYLWEEKILRELKPITVSYQVSLRNLGNTDDNIELTVPTGELTGEKSDWEVKFDNQSSGYYSLQSLEPTFITVEIIIDEMTDAGWYTLDIMARSLGDSSVTTRLTLNQNLTYAHYQVHLEAITTSSPDINPSYNHEIEYRFKLHNYGQVEDVFTVEVETSVTSGTYRNWMITFRDWQGQDTQTMTVPEDVNEDVELQDGHWIEISVFVVVDTFEDAGNYPDITVSARSESDYYQTDEVSFSVDVIRPNIRISSDPVHFSIDPATDLEVGDAIDIIVRVYNDGDAESDTFHVWFYNGEGASPEEEEGEFIAVEKINNISPQSYFEIVVAWEGLPVGMNDIFVYADKPIRNGNRVTIIDGNFSQDGSIIEIMERNNYASIDLSFRAALDLRLDVTPVEVLFEDTKPGAENVTVTVKVANKGTAPLESGSATMRLMIGDEYLRDMILKSTNPFIPESIPINDWVPLDFSWNIPEIIGKLEVNVTIEYPQDRNTTNNTLITMVTIRSNGTDPTVSDPTGPDLYIDREDITISSKTPAVGKKMTVTIKVRNQGDTSAEASVSLFLTGFNAMHLETAPVSVPFGDGTTITVAWTPQTVGNHAFIARVHDVVPKDRNGSNNEVQFTVEVVKDGESDNDGSEFIPSPDIVMVISLIGIALLISSSCSGDNQTKK